MNGNKKKYGFICLLFYISTNCFCQGYNNLWLMGYENYNPFPLGATNIDFISGTPNAYFEPNRTMQLQITDVNVADSLGNILFYSNGAWIANKNNQLMLNGDSLNPSYYTTSRYQRGLRLVESHVPLFIAGNDSIFYLIHQSFDDSTLGWVSNYTYYSIININGNGGLGEVTLKNQIFLNDSLNLQIVACKHANGRDWWITIPEWGSPNYYVYLLSPTGLVFNSKQRIGTRTVSGGQAVFSRDGTLYASYDSYTDLELFDFDRCTGTFSNARHVAINDSMSGTGISISPNNRFIYASSVKYVYQFDLQNLQNYQKVAVWDSFYSPGPPFATLFLTQELMQDNKIYINTGNSTDYLHVINFPDSLGLSCDLQQHSFHLPTLNSSSTPFYPNYSLGPVVGSICDSLTGIADHNLKSAELRINPNPCKEDVWINYHFQNNKDGWLEIYNSIGKLIIKRRLYWSTTQLLLHLNDLANGLYVVHVYDDSKMYSSSGKLIKN